MTTETAGASGPEAAPERATRRAEFLAFLTLAVLIWPIVAGDMASWYGCSSWSPVRPALRIEDAAVERSTIDRGRRNFLTGKRLSLPDRVRPPWSRTASIAAACTGCGACVPACPQRIVILDESGRATLDFGMGECSFCGA